jgi:nitroreductase
MLENNLTQQLVELMKHRRSIRRYNSRQVSIDDLRTIVDAGLYAPNAGGGQRSMIVTIHNPEIVEKVGRLNASCMRRNNLAGGHVSAEQPSLIDDPSIKSGFYGAPAVAIIFGQRNFLYSVPDAFCIAENMVLAATSLGISSCIVARGEETFDNADGATFLSSWNVPDNMIARCFVTLGYCDGPYPDAKPRRQGRTVFIE